jgi:hypothetical protein
MSSTGRSFHPLKTFGGESLDQLQGRFAEGGADLVVAVELHGVEVTIRWQEAGHSLVE